MARTPASQDKRLWTTVGCILAVVVLGGLGRHLNEQELTFIGLTLTAYITQSQYGQTKRTVAATEAASARPAP